MKPYAWHTVQSDLLKNLASQNRLPHALIFAGPPGTGKTAFANWFASYVMCEQDRGRPCGMCQSCTLVEQESHPDFRQVTLLKDAKTGKQKKDIGIDQVRELIQFVSLSQAADSFKTVVISPADALNVSSANSLLKLLEEPQGSTVIMLVADQLEFLPATIRSRCQVINMPLPSEALAVDWLKQQSQGIDDPEKWLRLAQGAPLLAVSMADELTENDIDYNVIVTDCLNLMFNRRPGIVEVARSWQKCPLKPLLQWQLGLSRDLLRSINALPKRYFENQGKYDALQKVRDRLNLTKVLVLYDYLIDINKKVEAPLKAETFREQLAAQWKNSL